jgi:beta-lactamase regulating signal transducer with metallopeptidase domain
MWFETTVHVLLSVLTVAVALSVIAVVLGLVTRRRCPALEHACWVVVLLRLAVPPFVPLVTPGLPEHPYAVSVEQPDRSPLPSGTNHD